MPIRAEMRWFYPIDWPQLSRHVRFERAGGVCQSCGRPHGEVVCVLPDGRWFDTTRQTWRNGRGRSVRWPDINDAVRMRQTRIILAAAHLDHDPGNNRLRNLKSLCQRCHLIHDRPHHLTQRRLPICNGVPSAICFWALTRRTAVRHGMVLVFEKHRNSGIDPETVIRKGRLE